jgi:hypothetical protein
MPQPNPRIRTDDELYTSWAQSIERTASELSHIYNSRDVFRHVRMMFDTQPAMFRPRSSVYTDSAAFVLSWLARMYAVEVLMFIRREYDTQSNTINLLKLLGEMKDRPTVLTRQRLRRQYDKMTAPESVKDEVANGHFENLEVERGAMPEADHVAAKQILDDLAVVEAQTATVRKYANRELAHRTEEWQPPSIGVPDDLDPPLSAILGIFNRYYPLLTGKSMSNPTPQITFYWEECLTHVLATNAYFEAVKQGQRVKRTTGEADE